MSANNFNPVSNGKNFRYLISGAAASVSIIFGLIVITGWFSDIQILKSLNSNFTPIAINTALCFIFTGIALLILQPRGDKKITRVVSNFFSTLVLALSLLTLAEYIFTVDFGIDQFISNQQGAVNPAFPGRMAPNTAICFSLIAISLLLLAKRSVKKINTVKIINLFVLFIASFAIIGYLTNISIFYSYLDFTSIALYTSITLIIVVIGIYFLLPKVKKQVLASFLIALLIILFAGIVAIKSNSKLQDSVNLVSHTHEVLQNVEETLTLLTDMETETKGYSLTGDTLFLHSYKKSITAIPSAIQTLQQLTANNPGQHKYIDSLKLLVDDKLKSADNIIKPGREEAVNSGVEKIASSKEIAVVSDLRHVIAQIKSAENKLLKERLDKETKDAKNAETVILTFIFLLFGLMIFIYYILSRDITDLKLTEEVLRESEQQLTSIYNTTGDAIYYLKVEPNQQYRFVSVNSAFSIITGIPIEQISGKKVTEIIPEPSLSLVLENYRKAIKEKGIIRWEETSDYPTGRLTDEVSITPVFDNSGICTHLVGSVHNITDRKLAEDELKKKNIFIQTVLDNLPIGVALNKIDQGTAFYNNKKFEEIYGWPSEELADVTEFFLKVYPDKKHRDELVTRVMADIQSGDPSRMHWEDCKITHKDGSKHIVNAVNIPLLEQNTMVSTVIDYTEINKAKEKAEQINRLKSSFFTNMSHELRTPLIGILGFAEMLTSELADPDQSEMANNIYKSGKRLNETLNLILDFSKAESDNLEMTAKNIDAAAIVKECANMLCSAAAIKNLKMETIVKDENIFARLDERLFVGVLNNLINNAIKFTREGTITIETGKEYIRKEEIDEPWFYVKVKDTGIGLSRESISIIFDEFRQASEGYGRSFEGTGLGLTISKKITELMGGLISVESKPGIGSVFTIKFPALEYIF